MIGNFLWGAATAAYQIEGAAAEEGKGPSVWDAFSHTPGKVKNGDNGDAACDHYHLYKEDIALMAELGLKAYRFSISWPRVLPEGVGQTNEQGFDFYDRLTDELLANNIQPCATLFHWDLPLALHDRGGWLNDDAPKWFAEYAEKAARRLGDRIPCWMTFNEMEVVVSHGYRYGIHAPGEQLAAGPALAVLKNMLLSHGRGVQALRAALPAQVKIGLAHAGPFCMPAEENETSVQMARRAMFEGPTPPGLDTSSHSLYLDPVVLGREAAWGRTYFGSEWKAFTDEELAVVSQPLDFLGINCYWSLPVCADADGQPVLAPFTPEKRTFFNWPVTSDALYWVSKLFYERYGLPIMITENGMSNNDAVSDDGNVHDPERIDFLSGYLRGLRRAADEEVPLLGYLQWSLLDNFEWAEGYLQRFGLIHVDYATKKRTPKDSAFWYRDVIASNGCNL